MATLGASSPAAALAQSPPSQAALGQTLRDYAGAWLAGDVASLRDFYHDDFTLIYPGRHALAGIHRGKGAALGVLQEVARRTQRQLIEISDILVGAREGALHVVELWRREAREERVERLLVYEVRDGKLFQCRLFDADQHLVDGFLG